MAFNIDLPVIAIFVLGAVTALLAVRWGRPWLMVVSVASTVVVGARALFLFEFGSAPMAALLSALFFAGVLNTWYNAERLRKNF